MASHPLTRVGLCIIGYVAAFFFGVAAVWLKNLGVSPQEMLASSGMFAFGDAITFLPVFAVAAVPPSIGLLRLIDFTPRVWRFYATGSLLIASTGLLAALLLFIRAGTGPSLLGTVQMFAVLRVLVAPLNFLLFVPGIFFARGAGRTQLLVACGLEFAAVCAFTLHMMLLSR